MKHITKNMIKDKKGFIDLFHLNIPHIDHFDYYIGVLSQTERYENIKDNLIKYGDLILTDSCKSSYCNKVIEFIKSTNSFVDLDLDISLESHKRSPDFKYQEEKKYISIDVKNSRWKSLSCYDIDNRELGKSFKDLLISLNIPEIFAESKHFKQLVFNSISPKKLPLVQRKLIKPQIDEFSKRFNMECSRTDESIFSFKSMEDLKTHSEFLRSIDLRNFNMKIFTVERMEDYRVDSIYDLDGKFIKREILNIDSEMFYLRMKNHILNEKIDIRDLYFINPSGYLSIIISDDLKISI